jgi:hypothetical protein
MPIKIELRAHQSLSLQAEFAPCASLRGAVQSMGMLARAVVDDQREGRDSASLPPGLRYRRRRMGASERQVEGLFERLLVQSFRGESWIKN